MNTLFQECLIRFGTKLNAGQWPSQTIVHSCSKVLPQMLLFIYLVFK